MLIFVISLCVTLFLLLLTLTWLFAGENTVESRLAEVAGTRTLTRDESIEAHDSTLGSLATAFTGYFKPLRGLVSGDDEDLQYRLGLAGYRKPEHAEIFTACKMLLPVVGIVAASYTGNLLLAALVGVVVGFFLPDMVLSWLTTKRQEKIRLSLPDAMDLLVICMEAGLGIDQGLVRVGEEMKISCPPLADEFQIIALEQRAGKPRLDAWRSMAARVDIDYVRQFVAMLVQTERYGTPIATALGQFADSQRERRTQAAEEMAAKTGVKLLFPLVLFIFPSIFVVTLGPAILGIHKLFQEMFR
jgi:tight adherence protein C